MYGEKVSQKDFLRRVLGMGGVAVAAFLLAACAPGELLEAMTTVAHKALQRFGLRGARLRQLRQGFVKVFHVASSAGEGFCLRMYDLPAADDEHASRPAPPPGRPSLEQLRGQLLWLSALAREMSLLVPELVPAVDGSLRLTCPLRERRSHTSGVGSAFCNAGCLEHTREKTWARRMPH